jgi:hypothetical protein
MPLQEQKEKLKYISVAIKTILAENGIVIVRIKGEDKLSLVFDNAPLPSAVEWFMDLV